MQRFGPVPWSQVQRGMQVERAGDLPRTVLDMQQRPTSTHLVVWLEGLPAPILVAADTAGVMVVVLDESDAAATLRAAGFTATPIEQE